jgi:hypothetical protein
MSTVLHEEHRTRNSGGGGGAANATVNVDVKPKIKQGNSVYCEIYRGQNTGENNVKGGVIKLPDTGTVYTVNFNLVADPDVPNVSWSANGDQCNGFWSNGNACPTASGQDPQITQAPSISTNDANVLTLQITPSGSKGVIHYQLNFDQQDTTLQFDPIIVVN